MEADPASEGQGTSGPRGQPLSAEIEERDPGKFRESVGAINGAEAISSAERERGLLPGHDVQRDARSVAEAQLDSAMAEHSALESAIAEARLLAVALQGEDPALIDAACEEAEAAGLRWDCGTVAVARRRASVLREAKTVEAVVRSTELLVAVVNAGDPEQIERACKGAEATGVSRAMVVAARQRARQLQEASLLAAAIRGGDPSDIEREIQSALASGMDEGMVAVARDRARQLREARLLSAAVSGTDAAEIETACEEAVVAGVSERTILAARRRVRQLREERMLAVAMRSQDASVIDRACDEAEESGVGAQVVVAVRRRAQQLREALLVATMRSGSAIQIELASDEAETFGVEASVVAAARAHARQLRRTLRAVTAIRALDAIGDAVAAATANSEAPGIAMPEVDVASVFAAGRLRARQAPPFLSDAEVAAEPGSECAAACTICFDALRPDEDVLVLPCRHAFHCGCVGEWIRTQGTCPNCRWRVDADDAGPTRESNDEDSCPSPEVE